MSGQMGSLALDGGDVRTGSTAGVGTGPEAGNSRPVARKLHDPSITMEEYMHYASITRADTQHEAAHGENTFAFGKPSLLNKKNTSSAPVTSEPHAVDEKSGGAAGAASTSPAISTFAIADEEYIQASRAVRTATWGAVFYLITTDILGPFTTAWAFKQMGYGPAVVLYTIFGILAAYGGALLWKMFLQLDSDRYPLKTFGDLAYRVYGSFARHTVSLFQSVQLFLNVGIIIVTSGQGLSQIAAKGPDKTQDGACFIILCFVWAIAGAILGQIRTLQRLGWIANVAIWMNVFIIISSMAVIAHSGPNFTAAKANNMVDPGPVVKTAGPPPGVAFDGQVVGLMQAVFSYGGAMLFIEFMSEMKRPFDFWKGMLCAQTFIFFCYLFYGLFCYSYQGQFTINPAFQGISNYAWQTVTNSLYIVSSLIAGVLYGNIGIKVVYNNVLMELLKFPSLGTRAGKLVWVAVVPIYWGVAFVVAAAIPQVSNLSGLIAAACILQFSYTFPPMIMLGFQVKKDALQAGEGFDPSSGRTTHHDSGFARYRRGYMKKFLFNTFNLIFFLGSCVTAILGIYSAAKGIKDAYAAGAPPSFSCRSPVLTG